MMSLIDAVYHTTCGIKLWLMLLNQHWLNLQSKTDTIKLFLYVEQILMFFLIYAWIILYNIIFSMYCLVKNSIQKLGTEYIFQMCQH